MANKPASMTEVWRYFAGSSVANVPTTLTPDQKSTYRLSDFRKDWEALTEDERTSIKTGLGNGSFTYV